MTWSPFLTLVTPASDVDDDARALVTEDRRKQTLGIGARAREFVGVADAGRLDLDQHLAGLRPRQLHGFDGQGRSCLVSHRCANIHGLPPSVNC